MKKLLAYFMALTMVLSLAGCGKAPAKSDEKLERTEINIVGLKGPTAMGMAQLMEQSEKGATAGDYKFTLAAAPDEIKGGIINGEFDIAAVPTNLASVLYNKTEGKVQVIALNTMGVLSLVENGDTIKSIKDLAGKKIVATGQGSTPEYALNFILEKNGITDATVEYKAEHAEAAALLASGDADIALLPQPFVTSAMMQNDKLRIALDLTEEWEKVADGDSALTMGCLVVQKEFAENNKAAVDAFLKEYKASADFSANKKNASEAAALIEKFDIFKAAVAEKALPNCNIVYVDGKEMKTSLEGFLNVLFEANPKAIGGKMPSEDFYYNAK